VDGIYGAATTKAVETFQSIFNMPQTGIVDYATWYEISKIYTAVNKLA
jgi:peptidoglycan hydrolase-like protein with peptidoglycan-binding domain